MRTRTGVELRVQILLPMEGGRLESDTTDVRVFKSFFVFEGGTCVLPRNGIRPTDCLRFVKVGASASSIAAQRRWAPLAPVSGNRLARGQAANEGIVQARHFASLRVDHRKPSLSTSPLLRRRDTAFELRTSVSFPAPLGAVSDGVVKALDGEGRETGPVHLANLEPLARAPQLQSLCARSFAAPASSGRPWCESGRQCCRGRDCSGDVCRW